MFGRILLYSILAIPLTILLVKILVVGLSKKQMPSGWLAISVVVLAIVLFIFCLFDTGNISRFVVKVDGKDYYISSNALGEVILKNIDNLGRALAEVYEKFYIVETFDCSKESETVQYVKKDDGIYIKIKLKYQPVLNSLVVFLSEGWSYTPSLEQNEMPDVDKDLFYWTIIRGINSIEELRKEIEGKNLIAEIRYLRKD